MATMFDSIISRIYGQMKREGIEYRSILPNVESWNFENLEKWLKDAEEIFSENENQKNLVRDLYKIWKVALILNCRPLTIKGLISTLTSLYSLSSQFQSKIPSIVNQLYGNIREGIESLTSSETALEWWKVLDHFKTTVGNEKAELFINFIKKRLGDILKERTEDNPRKILLFLSKKIDDKIYVNDLVNFTMKQCLEKVEQEWRSCNLEFAENLKGNIEELLRIIGVIESKRNITYDTAEAKKTLSRILRSLYNKQSEAIVRNIGHEESEINYMTNIDEDKPIDPKKITQEMRLPFKYKKNCLEVTIRQGILDNSEKICIFYFFDSSNEHYQIFKKEKELIKCLSYKHVCFLKYYGWFNSILSENDQYFNSYAIVTERFKWTLIEDIMHHSKHQVKYTQNWFLEIAKDLLDAFDYLEKLNIPHYDIRPHNILVTEKNKVKISGFNFWGMELLSISGNAVEIEEEIWRDLYAAPELNDNQRCDRNEISSVAKAGVFSLGLVFLQIYSLYKIAELNTPEYHEEIDNYVSTFKPKLIADLLRRMLKINKNKRPTFFECLQLLLPKGERKEESQDIMLQKSQISLHKIQKILERLKRIESSDLESDYSDNWPSKTSENGIRITFKKGKYKNDRVLIRIFESSEPDKLLPFLEEAEILENLNNPVFIKYYGLEWLNKIYSSQYSLSLITELCESNLTNDITIRAPKYERYSDEELKNCVEWLLQGFIALKDIGYNHGNIKSNVLLLNKDSQLKITGFITPNHKIESCCIFPSCEKELLQSYSGYISPEKYESKEKGDPYYVENSDIYFLGLIFLQMCRLKHLNLENEFSNLHLIEPLWLSKLLRKMLIQEFGSRQSFREIYNEMKRYLNYDLAAVTIPISHNMIPREN